MSADPVDKDVTDVWESAHVCLRCRLVINLADLDLTAITTGIAVCPQCDWSGPIEIEIVQEFTQKKSD